MIVTQIEMMRRYVLKRIEKFIQPKAMEPRPKTQQEVIAEIMSKINKQNALA